MEPPWTFWHAHRARSQLFETYASCTSGHPCQRNHVVVLPKAVSGPAGGGTRAIQPVLRQRSAQPTLLSPDQRVVIQAEQHGEMNPQSSDAVAVQSPLTVEVGPSLGERRQTVAGRGGARAENDAEGGLTRRIEGGSLGIHERAVISIGSTGAGSTDDARLLARLQIGQLPGLWSTPGRITRSNATARRLTPISPKAAMQRILLCACIIPVAGKTNITIAPARGSPTVGENRPTPAQPSNFAHYNTAKRQIQTSSFQMDSIRQYQGRENRGTATSARPQNPSY